MTEKEYYTPIPEHIFNEIKSAAIEIWKTYDDQHGYATEKIGMVNTVRNDGDGWQILAMFDHSNKIRLALKVSDEAALLIAKVLT